MLSTAHREGIHYDIQVREIFLIARPFSVMDGLLTSSQKLKRDVAQVYFQATIEEMTNRLQLNRSNSLFSRSRALSGFNYCY